MSYKILAIKEINGTYEFQEVGDQDSIHLNLPQYTDNTTAVNAGLTRGDWYQDNNGFIKIVQ